MKRQINVILGPHFEKVKRDCQRYYAEVVKRNIEQDRYKPVS